ncbi:Tyrosine recombinase XerC [bioreactor metagenome]|uniref:Tyrosine recombinase XerC n=1 Tax=bioreactor metagenome TaxID=1076179 RepID=A0A644U6N3_9ZZZZ|nr:site-specific integrase [Methanocorpusculum sp.]
MGTNQRFHCSQGYYLEHTLSLLQKAVEDGRINEDERAIIDEYIGELVAVSQISPVRRYKLVGTIIRNHEFHPPFTECKIKDVYHAIDLIKTATAQDGTPRYKKNTIADLVQMVKRFFIWLAENEYCDIDLRKLKKIRAPRYNQSTVTADMLLTESEVLAIIGAANNSRDRALISLLYEGGFRIGEVGNLTWKQVEFTDWNVTVNTAEKTGKPRYVPLAASRSYLAQWKNDYPLPITPSNYVFLTSTTHKPLQYAGLVKQIRALALRAGVKKHIKPHIFRHSRITHLCQKGLNESVIKLMMWGDVNTNMMKVYQHLTNSDVNAAIAELNGVSIPNTENTHKGKKTMAPVQCARCATVNSPNLKYCGNCGAPLTKDEEESAENMTNEIRSSMAQDPAFLMEMYSAMQQVAKEHNIILPIPDQVDDV